MSDKYYLNGVAVQNPLVGMNYDQRRARDNAQDKVRQLIQAETERNTKPESSDERLIRSNREYISELEREFPYALPARREQIKNRLAMLNLKTAELEQRQKAEAAEAKFSQSPLVQSIRDHVQVFSKIHGDKADFAVAISQSNDWPDELSMSKAYHAEVDRIESEVLARQQIEATEANIAAAKAEAEAARAQITATETAQRLQKAREAAQ